MNNEKTNLNKVRLQTNNGKNKRRVASMNSLNTVAVGFTGVKSANDIGRWKWRKFMHKYSGKNW